jgi:hypothetical protein
MPFISDRSGARPLRLDDGVTTKMDSSACGTSLRGIESLSGGYTREDHITDRSTGLRGTGEVYFRIYIKYTSRYEVVFRPRDLVANFAF